jgi:hypothetical protein
VFPSARIVPSRKHQHCPNLERFQWRLNSGRVVLRPRSGLDIIRNSRLFEMTWPFFERVRLPDSNAWTMNLLYSKPALPTEDVKNLPTAGERC